MNETMIRRGVAHLVDPHKVATDDVLGPTVHYLTEPETEDLWPCVMRGTIPPDVVVPLHCHADPETCVGGTPWRGGVSRVILGVSRRLATYPCPGGARR
jgi:hypothetical protein